MSDESGLEPQRGDLFWCHDAGERASYAARLDTYYETPDGCAYVVDYGVVRDFGQSDPKAKFITAGDGPLVQIQATGVVWKICAAQ